MTAITLWISLYTHSALGKLTSLFPSGDNNCDTILFHVKLFHVDPESNLYYVYVPTSDHQEWFIYRKIPAQDQPVLHSFFCFYSKYILIFHLIQHYSLSHI